MWLHHSTKPLMKVDASWTEATRGKSGPYFRVLNSDYAEPVIMPSISPSARVSAGQGLPRLELLGIITCSFDACSVRDCRSEEAEMTKRMSAGDVGPLSMCAEGFREDLEGRGYTPDSAR